MNVFTHDVQPFLFWLHTNPSWALLFTFLISCAESLAIIGSIIPGSLTMTAVGILAGSGVMRIDLTLGTAALGALAGDGMSYALGYRFSDRLTHIWPFSRYPNLLRYGKDFFVRHGGKSVLIGRFIGPLRSMIPVIAGMMHMPRVHFFFANLCSAIGWAILYVMPGYLIGTASHQLSTDSARRLFGFIIVLLLTVWIASKGIRWLAHSIHRGYNAHLTKIYSWSKHHDYFKRLFRDVTSEDERTHGFTITLLLAWIFCVIMALCLTVFAIQNTWINELNSPISFFLQSLRTQLFDDFFIGLNLIISPLSLFSFFCLICGAAIYVRDWRLLRYWISVIVITLIVTWLLTITVHIPNPVNLYRLNIYATFPVMELTWATSLFSFTLCYLIEYHRNELSLLLRACLTTILVLTGFSSIYFGDNWMTSVIAAYCIGLTISLIHWVLYQRQTIPQHHVGLIITLAAGLLLITMGIEYAINFQKILTHHAYKPHQYELSEDMWWHQSKPILPLYTTNRMGKNIGLFNIQYAGSIRQLEQRLVRSGWEKQSSPLLYTLMIRVGGQHAVSELPMMEQLYLNKKPKLIMTRTTHHNHVYILRLWKSNYHISHYHEPIWLGSILLVRKKNTPTPSLTLFTPMFPAIKTYRVTRITVTNDHIKSLQYAMPLELLIIKE